MPRIFKCKPSKVAGAFLGKKVVGKTADVSSDEASGQERQAGPVQGTGRCRLAPTSMKAREQTKDEQETLLAVSKRQRLQRQLILPRRQNTQSLKS
eukprot:757234-Hanusia_phi.AAC.1